MTTPPAAADVRTTPGWLRVPALMGMVALAGYFMLCVNYSLMTLDKRDQVHPWIVEHIDWFWLGNWKMFTGLDRWHVEVKGQALYGREWREIDLLTLFPSVTESGPRYQRGPFRRRAYRVRLLASSTCHRLDEPPDRVKIEELKWKATLGQVEQPRGHYKYAELADWNCAWPHPGPAGEVW
jgi:hypothetical protein